MSLFRLRSRTGALCALLTATFSLEAAEAALFNGKDFSGWRYWSPSGSDMAKVCEIKEGGILAVVGKPNGYLLTRQEYRDYRLHLEWRVFSPKTNSGVLVHETGPDKLWPTCMQAQLKVGAVGEFIPMEQFRQAVPLSAGAKSFPRLAKSNPEKPVGEWNSMDLICKGGSVECRVNGVLVNRLSECKPDQGFIGIQLEGQPFELRNIRLDALE